ncbi:TadE family type IV pilus minor pilin [Pseudonocardia bannensis]|uniref:TadE family type IV pilus minor pilin n=1 Tax=Pseudonocardia bannensis TaxID=630973 RepID=UPI0028A58424|nr:TadE family type IV pilus minor pilin [Pseudonocardia bannensis]
MTVEAAVALGTLAVTTVLAVGSVATVVSSVRCVDAARELARLAARGEADRGRSIAAQLAPSTAAIDLSVTGDEVTAVVTATPLGPFPVQVRGRAVAVLEPGVAGAAP